MSNKFAVCPTCGAVGAVGKPCEYCGTLIVEKEDTATYEERIVPTRTISPMAFAQRISIFKEVGEYICNCAIVSMGGVRGVINLNGDLIFPLEYSQIKIYPPDGIVYLQKGSDRFFFDLVRWKRIKFSLSVIPEKVERKFYYQDEDHEDYYYSVVAVGFRSSSAIYDKDDRIIATGASLEETNRGLIVNKRKYFDFRTRKVYELPFSDYYGFSEKRGVLCIQFEGSNIVLDIEGKTSEEIQNEIRETIQEIENERNYKNSGDSSEGSEGSIPNGRSAEEEQKKGKNIIKYLIAVIAWAVLFFLLLWTTGAFEN